MTYPVSKSFPTDHSNPYVNQLSIVDSHIIDSLYCQMTSLPNSPFKSLKKENLWKLFFMERENLSFGPSYYEEKEPGYLQGIMKGYSAMLSTLGERLSPELYLHLHDSSVDGVFTADCPEGIPKGFRKYQDGAEAFGLIPGHTLSERGKEELLDRLKKYEYFDEETGNHFFFLREAIYNPAKIFETTPPVFKLNPTRPETCKNNVQICIDIYENTPKNTEDEILQAIAGICQDLDQLHLFVDGNIRTTGILLLNKLLIENSLSPSVMNDVNQIDCLSRGEIVELIREGQTFFQGLTRPFCARSLSPMFLSMQ